MTACRNKAHSEIALACSTGASLHRTLWDQSFVSELWTQNSWIYSISSNKKQAPVQRFCDKIKNNFTVLWSNVVWKLQKFAFCIFLQDWMQAALKKKKN